MNRGDGAARILAAEALIFGAATFLSSLLMFAIEPMVGKALLPAFGGGATVWASVMLFFQCIVLAGYALAHGAIMRIGTARAAVLLVGVAACGLALAPVVPSIVDPGSGPAMAVFLTLASGYGLACIALSAATPSVQAWFAAITGREPYRLYAISNAGSLLGLALYPAVFEPNLGLAAQGNLWRGAFAAWLALIAVCAVMAWRHPRRGDGVMPTGAIFATMPPSPGRRLAWLLLAMLPSSLLLGVTQHITVDIAPFPLLWVAPLGIYLLTFIVAFALPDAALRRGRLYHACLLPLLVVFAIRPELDGNLPLTGIVVHLAGFGACALLCHGRLAELRPGVGRLTEFYLIVAAGGALGGVFNVLIAPLLFDRLSEYPLMLAATCLVLPPFWRSDAISAWRSWPALLPAAGIAMILCGLVWGRTMFPAASDALRVAAIPLAVLAIAAATATSRLGLTLAAAIGLVGPLYLDTGVTGTPVFSSRDFYGPLRVTDRDGSRLLLHGTTMHGQERAGLPTTPTAYYAPRSGIGRLIGAMTDAASAARPVQALVVGLGAGTLACYGGAKLHLAFVELDPDVLAVARRFFGFLRGCGNPAVEVGDGRLLLASHPDHGLDLLVMDAFSSDAVPAHLITAEAIALALAKLAPGGAVAVHVSNNYLDLAPVIAGAAAANGRITLRFDAAPPEVETASIWTVVTDDAALSTRLLNEGWRVVPPPPPDEIWHDDRWTVMHALKLLHP